MSRKNRNPLFDVICDIACNFEPACECTRAEFDEAVTEVMVAVWKFVLWQRAILLNDCTSDHVFVAEAYAELLHIVVRVEETGDDLFEIEFVEFDCEKACEGCE